MGLHLWVPVSCGDKYPETGTALAGTPQCCSADEASPSHYYEIDDDLTYTACLQRLLIYAYIRQAAQLTA
jgi:hypothetical protein